MARAKTGGKMIPDIKNILYATDLSDNAIHAFSYAATIANRFGAKISIVHVFEELSYNFNALVSQILGEDKWAAVQIQNIQKVRDTIAERLDAFCGQMTTELKACPFIVDRVIVERGVPFETILHQAEKLNSDLIVMGTHGHGIVGGAMMGSTARRVVRRSTLPVMTIRLS